MHVPLVPGRAVLAPAPAAARHDDIAGARELPERRLQRGRDRAVRHQAERRASRVIGHRAELERHKLAVRPRYHVDCGGGVAGARAVGEERRCVARDLSGTPRAARTRARGWCL